MLVAAVVAGEKVTVDVVVCVNVCDTKFFFKVTVVTVGISNIFSPDFLKCVKT